jgi:hypothetical protein
MLSRTLYLGGVSLRTFGLSALAVLAAFAASAAHAQEPKETARPDESSVPVTGEEVAEPSQEMIDQIRSLVPEQQRAAALQLIERYPNSEVAENARELIVEFDAYVRQAAQDRLKDEARNRWVRKFWDAQRPPRPVVQSNPTRIFNESKRSVLYQIKGAEMEWSHMVRILPGELQTVNYPARVRLFSSSGTTEMMLPAGGTYIFRSGDDGKTPLLYTVPMP